MPPKPIKIGIYQVTRHDSEPNEKLGSEARVTPTMTFDSKFKKGYLEVKVEHGPEVEWNQEPAYGRGKTLREHEETHVRAFETILKERQPPKSLTDEDRRDYLQHTKRLIDTCHVYYADKKRPFFPTPDDQAFYDECRKILKF